MKTGSITTRCLGSLVAVSFLFFGCSHVITPRYHDDLVEITEHSTIQYLNVHSSTDTEVLMIWGRSYKDVRGLNPCYLSIPGRPLILFVTGLDFDGGQAVVHLANTSTHEIRSFPAYDSHIGSGIGRADDWAERITSLDGDMLVLEVHGHDRHYRFFIDLKEPRFIREEAEYPDSMTSKWKHYVLEGGKWPKSL